MAAQNNRSSMYPEVIQNNPNSPNPNPSSSSSSNLYPSIDMKDLVENLFQEQSPPEPHYPSAPPEATEETIIRIPGAILNLIDKHYSVELACGDFTVVRLRQGDNVVAVLARVADEIQWPLAKDEAAVKLDDSHYFFSLRTPKNRRGSSGSDSSGDDDDEEGKRKSGKANGGGGGGVDYDGDLLNYGLTIASKGQEGLVKELDGILQAYSSYSVHKVTEKVLERSMALQTSPADLKSEKKKEMMEERSALYWTTLAPNVEDYSGSAAKLIATGSGQLIKGILWCGDVTVERLRLSNEVMKKKLNPKSNAEISPETLKRIKR